MLILVKVTPVVLVTIVLQVVIIPATSAKFIATLFAQAAS